MDMRMTGRRTIGAVVASLTAALLPWQSAWAEDTASAAPPPEVLPSLRQWQPGEGEFTLADRARIVLDGVRDSRTTADARRFAGEPATGRASVSWGHAAARAGDVVLRQDPGG